MPNRDNITQAPPTRSRPRIPRASAFVGGNQVSQVSLTGDGRDLETMASRKAAHTPVMRRLTPPIDVNQWRKFEPWQQDVVSGGGFGRSHFLKWRSDGERSRCVQNTTPRFAEGYGHGCYGLRACTEESSACHHRHLSMGVIFQPCMEGMPRAHLLGFGLPEMQSRGHTRMVLTKVFPTAFGS